MILFNYYTMSKFITNVLCIFLLIVVLSKGENIVEPSLNDELIAVALVYRHGDRSIALSYPNDPYFNESYWPDGFAQLLNAGKLKQYKLGQWLRKRYNKFLSKNYKKKEISVQSSGIDRSLMSAAATLAALYTPSEENTWVKGLLWEPVPIHSWPKHLDPYFSFGKPCPKHDKLLQKLKEKNDLFKKLPVEYREEYEIAARNTALNVTIDTFKMLYTSFDVYRAHNKSFLPSWATSFNKTRFTYLAGLAFGADTFTDALKTLKGGPFYAKLLEFLDNAINGTAEPKFLMMSAHDSTVIVALQIMGVYDFVPPEFSAMVIWELHKDPQLGYYMKMYYRRPSREQLEELILPECKQPCTYKQFHTLVSQYARDEETVGECCKITN